MKKALVTGITGQDGAYLLELLLSKGYEVHGIKRRASSFNTSRIDNVYENSLLEKSSRFKIHFGDLTDYGNLFSIINKIKPDEIYNLGAMSHVKVSFDIPEYTGNVDGLGTLRLLEAVRSSGLNTRIYQASTSELYGKVLETPQDENTPFYPRSPYGAAKIYGFWITKNYREAYNMFACNGILFNHESPLRGETFLTRKVTRGIAGICYQFQEEIVLGNLNSSRDWGHAKDYVEAMWLILQQDEPEDWVIGTGKTNTVREFVMLAFEAIGIKIQFIGSGIDEIGIVLENNSEFNHIKKDQRLVRVSKKYFRPTEVDLLHSNPEKAMKKLNWKPKYDLKALVKEMIDSDLQIFKQKRILENHGFYQSKNLID